MLSIYTERLFRDVLIEIMEGELQGENLRQTLCGAYTEFSPYSAFMRIDRTAEENLNGANILQFLRDNHIFQFTQADCQKLVNFYDSNRNGFLCYQDFLQILLPCEDLQLRVQTCNRQFFRVSRHEKLPMDMETALLNVFLQELRVFKELEKLTYDLQMRPDYSPVSTYRVIDRHNDGRIDILNLKQFFNSNNIFLSEREIMALIRRIDTKGDQTITLDELQDYIEQQVGFRSQQIAISMAKATPQVRKYMHQDLQKAQMSAIKLTDKVLGHECNPQYEQSPTRIKSQVLEQRVFQIPKKKSNQKRPKSSNNLNKKNLLFDVAKKSKYSNPSERPQHSQVQKLNRDAILTKLSSQNSSLVKALAPQKKQSEFMKKLNQPLIQNQINQDIIEAFIYQINLEKTLENQKIQLIQHLDFNLFDAFKIFDLMGRGSLTLGELYNGLVNQFELVPSQDEIELFFLRYDKDRDGRLRFTEYCDSFIPLDGHYAAMLNSRKSYHRSDFIASIQPQHIFSPITIMDFKEMWRTHFRVEVQAENLRQQLEENPLFNLSHAFDICDFNKKGEITPAEIRFLCQKRGFSVSEKESIFVFEKFDKSGKGVIHKNDFLQELIPKSKNRKPLRSSYD